ncbi:MAG: hypothetical protein F8N37_08990 [Telmatospirillum sp.]|nr:hypothetical protein [Telmatospirillum sp.]
MMYRMPTLPAKRGLLSRVWDCLAGSSDKSQSGGAEGLTRRPSSGSDTALSAMGADGARKAEAAAHD